MNELTDEVSMLEKAVLENDSFDLDTKLRIIRKIEESRARQNTYIPQPPTLTYKESDDTKIKINTKIKH